MSGENIATAVKEVATAVDKSSDSVGSMGIKGMFWQNVSQMTFGMIVAGALIYMGHEFISQSNLDRAQSRKQGEEDRALFRDAIKEMNSNQNAKYERTEATHAKAMEKMGATIDKSVTATKESADAMKTVSSEMKEAVKELRDTVRMVGKVGNPKGPGG